MFPEEMLAAGQLTLATAELRDAWAFILTGENVNNSPTLQHAGDAVISIQNHIDAQAAEIEELKSVIESAQKYGFG